MADTKELVVGGVKYVKEAIDKEFSEQEFKVDIDIPSLQIEKEPMIREDTFFKEDNK